MITIRIVAPDVDQLDATALAIGQVLTVTQESRPRRRRSGDGVTLYLDVELPPPAQGWTPEAINAADRADPHNQCSCGQYVPVDDAVPVPVLTNDGMVYARRHPACRDARQRRQDGSR